MSSLVTFSGKITITEFFAGGRTVAMSLKRKEEIRRIIHILSAAATSSLYSLLFQNKLLDGLSSAKLGTL